MPTYQFEYSFKTRGSYIKEFPSDAEAIEFLERNGANIAEFGDDYDWEPVDEDDIQLDELNENTYAVKRTVVW